MKMRLVQFGDSSFIVDENDAKHVARGFELLAITDEDTALTLLSLETGRSEVLLVGSMEIAKAMKSGDIVIWGAWKNPPSHFPLV